MRANQFCSVAKGFLIVNHRKDISFTQEWYSEIMWKSLPQWRKYQLIAESEEALTQQHNLNQYNNITKEQPK